MTLLRILVCMLAGLIAYSQECHAATINAGNMESMSTACSDGTKVFGVAGNGVISSSLYIEKNGKLIYANDEFEDIQHIWSVYCSRYAIILMGIHGSYYSGSAVTVDKNKIATKFITGSRMPAQYEETNDKLTVKVYGDDRQGEDKTIVWQQVFTKPFIVPSSIKSNGTANIDMNTALPGSPQKNIRLTTMASCCSTTKEDDFTVIAYIDENNLGNIAVIASYTINDSTSTKYTANIPFIGTNSLCIDGKIRVSGKLGNELQSALVYYDAEKENFAVEFISQ